MKVVDTAGIERTYDWQRSTIYKEFLEEKGIPLYLDHEGYY